MTLDEGPLPGQTSATLQLGRDGNADALLGEGWSKPGRNLRWAVGPVTRFRLPLGVPMSTRYVSIRVVPHIPPGSPPQRLTIGAAAMQLRHYVLTGPQTISFEVPWGLSNEIVLTLPDARPAAAPGERPIAVGVPWIRVLQESPAIDPAEMMAKFISLGSNCEFGFAQRHFGAEPIDLFRFASSTAEGLCHGFRTDFVDIDDPAFFRIELSKGDAREYLGAHPKYQMRYHTFIKEAPNVDPAVLLKRERGRLRFLARKLLDEAADAQRMFVYWHLDTQLDVMDLIPLRNALLRLNPANGLLVVEESRAGEHAGNVAQVARGLYRGTIIKFAPREDVPALDPVQWGRMCANALALWQPGTPRDG